MSRFEFNQKFPTKRFLTFVCGLVCSGTFSLSSIAIASENDFLLEGFEQYGIAENDFSKMRIVPTHMMDDDLLFRAAAAERDSSMTMSQRLINNRWLLEDPNISASPSAALRRYIRTYFIDSYKRERQRRQLANPDLYLSTISKVPYSQFSDISNYHLRVSDDKVRLRFRYKFD
ncbi:MAG: hypothetical protein K6L80_14395 [Agarilytica sp.]